jgi:hypothetical protein
MGGGVGKTVSAGDKERRTSDAKAMAVGREIDPEATSEEHDILGEAITIAGDDFEGWRGLGEGGAAVEEDRLAEATGKLAPRDIIGRRWPKESEIDERAGDASTEDVKPDC